MSPTEVRCAQIEKEALALTWAQSISVETDHKPLLPLLTTHTLDQLPPRIQRFRMRLMKFHLKEVKHVPAKKMFIADALSRLQVRKQAKRQPCCLFQAQGYSKFWKHKTNIAVRDGLEAFSERCHKTVLDISIRDHSATGYPA